MRRCLTNCFRTGAILFTLAACHHASEATSDANDTMARRELTAATQHYAFLIKSAPVDSVVNHFTPDGVLDIAGQSPLVGRTAIREFLAPIAGSTTVTLVEMPIDSLAVDHRQATVNGTYRQIAGPKDGGSDQLQEYRGRYEAHWIRARDGSWQISKLAMRPSN